jgi:hypothetical protein
VTVKPNNIEMGYRIGSNWAKPISHTVLQILDEPGFVKLSLENIFGKGRKSVPIIHVMGGNT